MAYLDTIGIDKIAAQIEAGLSQRNLAKEYAVDVAELNRWLHATPQRSARARAAMHESAEGWLDRGLAAIEDAPGDVAEIARARAIAQECARRAAVRNPAYRDKVDHTLIQRGTVTVQHLTRSQLLEIAAQAVPDQPQIEG